MPRLHLNVALVMAALLLVANAVAIAAPATPATFTVNHIMVANLEANNNPNMAPNNYATMNGAMNLDVNNTANNAVAANVLATNANAANVLLNADETAAVRPNFGAPRKLPQNAATNIANNAANSKVQSAG